MHSSPVNERMSSLIQVTEKGLYCAAADVFIDPWRPVSRALITHAHSDHARRGHAAYLAHHHCVPLLRARLGAGIAARGLEYGERVNMNGVDISLHPAGHVLGSAQVRLEFRGEVWVISGDYKLHVDNVAAPFEAVPCHTFVTESTFGLPVYRWPDPAQVMRQIDEWWAANQRAGVVSFLQAYSLGKAQRLLAGLPHVRGPIYVHGSIEQMNAAHLEAGVDLPECGPPPRSMQHGNDGPAPLIVGPPSMQGSPWADQFAPISYAAASGWMAVRSARRRRTADRGFVLSDHADWDGLNEAVRATGAERVYVTHGSSAVFARWLRERYGLDAAELDTLFGDDSENDEDFAEEVAISSVDSQPDTLSAAGQTKESEASLQGAATEGAATMNDVTQSAATESSDNSDLNSGGER